MSVCCWIFWTVVACRWIVLTVNDYFSHFQWLTQLNSFFSATKKTYAFNNLQIKLNKIMSQWPHKCKIFYNYIHVHYIYVQNKIEKSKHTYNVYAHKKFVVNIVDIYLHCMDYLLLWLLKKKYHKHVNFQTTFSAKITV